jgi:hypothetical protein
MPITIKNSAGGGVTLDSTTSSNETLQLPSGGGTLAPLASPSFTGNVVTQGVNPTITIQDSDEAGDGFIKFKTANGTQRGFIQTAMTANVMLLGTGTTEAMRIDSSGNVMAGQTSVNVANNGHSFGAGGNYAHHTSTESTALILNRKISNGDILRFRKDNTAVGSVSVTGSSTAYNTSSDYRLKENVTPMSGATAQTKLLKPCNFDWIVGGNVNGFLAHELAEVVPEAVTGTKDAMKDEEYEVTPATDTEAAVMGTRSVPDMQGIDQSKLVPLLTATIQDLIARIEALEA